MKKILLFCLILASYSLQSQIVEDHIRARSSLRIGGNTTTAATGIVNTMPGSPSTQLITAAGVYNWATGSLNFAGDVSGLYNNLTLANSGVTAGTCTNCSLTIDAKGRVTVKGSGSAGATYTAGTGIDVTGTVITNTAPNIVQNLSLSGQALSISGGTGVTLPVINVTAGSNISVTPVAGSFAVANTAPDQTVSITNGGGVAVTGTYPSFTLTATDQSTTNELQTLSYSAPNLTISGGNSVDISGNNYWSKATNDLYYTAGKVGIGLSSGFGAGLHVATNSALSTPGIWYSGTWITGGTTTTNKPAVLIEPTGTTSTAWSTAGTALGINAPSGFAGNIFDLKVNGVTAFTLSSFGTLTSTSHLYSGGNVRAVASGDFHWLTRSRIKSFSDGVITLYNDATSGFNRLQIGGTTNQFAGITLVNGGTANPSIAFQDATGTNALPISAGSITLPTPGNKINIATGANASIGTTTLVAGTVTVSTTAVTSSSQIIVCYNTPSGTLASGLSAPSGSIVNGTSFVINSLTTAGVVNNLDNSTVRYWIIN